MSSAKFTCRARMALLTTMMQQLGLLAPKAAEHYAMLRFEEPFTPLGLPSEEDLQRYAEWMQQNRLLKKGLPALSDVVFQEKK